MPDAISYQKRIGWFGVIVLVLLFALESSGQPNFQIRFYQFSDPEKSYDFRSIQKIPASSWREVHSPNFGNRGGYGWVRANFYCHRDQTLWLEVRSHFLNSLSIIYFSDKREFHSITTRNAEFTHQPIKHRYFLVPIQLRQGSTYTLLVRGYVPAPDVLKIPIALWSPSQFLYKHWVDQWGWAFFVGVITMAILLGLMGFLFHKENLLFLYFSLYAISIAVYALLNDGWGCFLPDQFRFLYHPLSLGHWVNACFLFFLLFCTKFLSVKPNRLPSPFKISPLWIAFFVEIFLFVIHLGEWLNRPNLFVLGYRMTAFFFMGYLFLWVGYVADAIKRNFKAVWIHLAGIGLFIAFFFTNALIVNTGIYIEPVPDMLILRIAILVDVVFLLLSWMYRNKILEQNRRRIEAEGIVLQQTIATAIQRQQADEIKALHLQNEMHQQRIRLARDLHDGIGSELTHIINRLDLLSIRSKVFQPLVSLSDFTRATNQNLRDTLWVLNQDTISVEQWYERTLHWLLKRWEDLESPELIPNYQADRAILLSPTLSISLFRITQEAANNCLKYANADRFEFTLRIVNDHLLKLLIQDDGCGMDLNSIKRGYGLANMESRIEELGGSFSVQSSPARGTRLNFSVPLPTKYVS